VGKIILLNTPIGNLGDLTPRVLEALKVGETFAVEDTRVFKDLLSHLGISIQGKKIYSLHDQSESSQVPWLLELAQRGDLYVASEAGSPMISDPAYPLVVAAYQAGIKLESYSGVSSPVMALELSGLPPIPFQFHGFLPRETGKRAKIFQETGYGTHIFFEAPTRIEETMTELAELDPNLHVVILRELSKKFEQVERFKSGEWSAVKEKINFKGEFILMFHRPQQSSGAMSSDVRKAAEEILENGAAPKQLSKLLSLILDRPTKEIYNELGKHKK
jgi:16S rRNA (cytidine1402-2'-O)-methyltransferase